MTDNIYQQAANTAELKRKAAQLAEIVTQPAVLNILKEIADAPVEERLKRAQELATVESLVGRGVSVPTDMRLTTRYFEDPDSLTRGDVRIDGAPSKERSHSVIICGGIGFVACITVGDPVVI
jgi:hypothetical protein